MKLSSFRFVIRSWNPQALLWNWHMPGESWCHIDHSFSVVDYAELPVMLQ